MGKLLNLLTMFGPLAAAKFWIALTMGVVNFVQVYTGFDLGLDQTTATTIINGIGAALIWLVPNKKPAIPVLTEAEARARTGYSGPIETRNR
ncbi:hypothetical protein V6617_10025 [Pelagibacterium nitratireducens]|uniref:Holin n=1 Tax=Pelagibacterium nitratireducens TaxID=1046114 RepID=A0ABZ2I0F7_9HYPH